MDDRAAVCWIHRRAGFGLAASELDAAIGRGPDAEIDALLSTDSVAAAVAADPWDDADPQLDVKDRKAAIRAINAWLDHLVATDTPLVDRIAWLWHGHFVSALDKVKIGRLMVDQIRLFRRGGLASFADLLGDVTVDPAMLLYLDGADSTGGQPNENFSREVLELFTIGLGGYSEADVKAGAAALTGWKVRRALGTASFVPKRHDDTMHTYLGRDDVHDVPSVTAAIMGHPDLSGSIASMISGELLGVTDAAVVSRLAQAFAASEFDITTLVGAALQEGLAGAWAPIVLAPVAWLAIAQRVTGASIDAKARLIALRTAGQVPMTPPNVAGWPSGAAWFGSSTIVARVQLAAVIAQAAPADNPARAASEGNDLVQLAVALGLPDPVFGDASTAALQRAAAGEQRLALALCSPEFVLA